MASRAALGLAAALALLVAAPRAARAQGHRRTFGIGSAVGGGVSYNAIPTFEPPRVAWGPQAALGTLELRFFFRHGGSIDVYSPLGNTLVSLVGGALPRRATEPGVLAFAAVGALYNFNVNVWRRRVFVLLAPGVELAGDIGLGGSFERTRPLKAAVRVPLRVGVEWLDRERTFGVMVMARAFAELVSYTRNGEQDLFSLGAAALLEVALVAY